MKRAVFNIFGLKVFFLFFALGYAGKQESEYLERRLVSDPITIPVVQKNKVLAYYNFELLFECKDKDTKEKIAFYLPRVLDKAITMIYSLGYSFWTKNNPITEEQIYTLLSREFKKVFPKGAQLKMHLQNFQISFVPEENQLL